MYQYTYVMYIFPKRYMPIYVYKYVPYNVHHTWKVFIDQWAMPSRPSYSSCRCKGLGAGRCFFLSQVASERYKPQRFANTSNFPIRVGVLRSLRRKATFFV